MVVKFAIGRFLFIRPPRHRHYLSRRRKESRQARRGSPRPPSSPSTRKRVQLLRGEGEGQGDSSRARAKRRKRKRKGDVRTNYSFDGLIEIRETAMGKWATIHAPRNIYIYIYLVRARTRKNTRRRGVTILSSYLEIERDEKFHSNWSA